MAKYSVREHRLGGQGTEYAVKDGARQSLARREKFKIAEDPRAVALLLDLSGLLDQGLRAQLCWVVCN